MENKKHFGVMLDCSRNAVINIPTAKRYIDTLAKMGYNTLMLYTEDTYEVDGHPFFGYMRGRYSKEEMKELVAYGEEKGIELIPCIQTLAHLNQLMRWSEYQKIRDCDDILLAGADETYELIEAMFKTLRECYKTDIIHIGMDEAHNVGLGNYLKKNGMRDRFEILSEHLARVAALAEKYGFKPIMWSDMFFRLATGGSYYVATGSDGEHIVKEEVRKLVPDNVELIYWDYYHGEKEFYDKMIVAHKGFNKPVWFAGGAWMWTGFTPHNNLSILRTEAALKSCREQEVDNVFITCWGDNGGEASPFSVLPALFYSAEAYRGNFDMESIKSKFEEMFGIAFDDYMKLDLPSVLKEEHHNYALCFDKSMLYSDPFLGFQDNIAENYGDINAIYKGHRDSLNTLADNPQFGYLFKQAALHCDLLSVKFCLGKNTREAYLSRDREQIAKVIELFKEVDEKLESFYSEFRANWMYEKKPHGFDVQDVRLGGLKMRLRSCRERLEDYLSGKLERIDELEDTFVSRGVAGTENNQWATTYPNAL